MGVSDTLKTSVVAGIALVAPLVVTFVAFRTIFGWLRGILNPIIKETGLAALSGNIEIVAELGALVILVGIIAVLGYVAQKSLGSWVFGLLDRLIGSIPIVSVIYGSVRQVSDALVNQESRYESVAMIEYPSDGLYALGFLTSESPQSVTTALGQDAYNVYLPNSPNPTQGRFVLVPADQVIELDMSVRRAIRLLMTTGIAEEQEELEAFQHDIEEQLAGEDISLDDIADGVDR